MKLLPIISLSLALGSVAYLSHVALEEGMQSEQPKPVKMSRQHENDLTGLTLPKKGIYAAGVFRLQPGDRIGTQLPYKATQVKLVRR